MRDHQMRHQTSPLASQRMSWVPSQPPIRICSCEKTGCPGGWVVKGMRLLQWLADTLDLCPTRNAKAMQSMGCGRTREVFSVMLKRHGNWPRKCEVVKSRALRPHGRGVIQARPGWFDAPCCLTCNATQLSMAGQQIIPDNRQALNLGVQTPGNGLRECGAETYGLPCGQEGRALTHPKGSIECQEDKGTTATHWPCYPVTGRLSSALT